MKKYLDLPIFSMVCLSEGVLVSCGGGGKRVGLENCLIFYPKPTVGLLKNPLDTLPLGDEIFEKMRLNLKSQLIVCNSEEKCVIVKIMDGKIKELLKFVSDHATKEAYQNDGVLNYNASILATGGEDQIVRLWEIRGKELDIQVKSMASIPMSAVIMSLDFHPTQSLLIVACDDMQCKLIKNNRIVQTLTIGANQLKFHSAFFSPDETTLYTFKNPMRGAAYMTVWTLDGDNINPKKTIKIHNHPVVTVASSRDGLFLGVGCSDGCVKIINTRYLDIEAKSNPHEMPIKALSFTPDSRFLVSGSADYTYNFLQNTRPEGYFSKITKLWFAGMVIAYLCTLIIDLFN